ncbi:MAG: Panacea domain-containing protein [Bacilli bacterium]
MSSKNMYVAYINQQLKENGIYNVSHMKYHKLLYFSLAYHLAYYDCEGFNGVEFEAWENGPVESDIRKDILYKNFGLISKYVNNVSFDGLSEEEKKSIEKIVYLMGKCSAAALSQLTHEDIFKDTGKTPWQFVNNERGYSTDKIDHSKIKEFYTEEWFEAFDANAEAIWEKMNAN